MMRPADVPGELADARLEQAVRYYRMLGTTARVEAPAPIAALLDRLCGQFAGSVRAADVAIDVREDAEGYWSIQQDGQVVATRQTAIAAARHVEWRLVGRAARVEDRLIHLHAAAVACGDDALLIAGRSRTGKSALALALAARGLQLLGDDVVLLEPTSGALQPFPRSPHVRDDVLPLLEAAGLPARAAISVPGFLDPRAVPMWRATPVPRLVGVVLLEPPGGDRAVLEPVSQAEAAVDLVLRSHHLPNRPDAWQILQHTLAHARCYRLRLAGDLGDASRLVEQALWPG